MKKIILILGVMLVIFGSIFGYWLWWNFDVYKIVKKEIIDYEIVAIENKKGLASLEAEDIIYFLDGNKLKKCVVGSRIKIWFDPRLKKPVLRTEKITGLTRSGRMPIEYNPPIREQRSFLRNWGLKIGFRDFEQYLQYNIYGKEK